MLSIEVKNRIRQFNPWITRPEKAQELTGRFLPSSYLHRSVENIHPRKDSAVLVVGPRQSGKSTMIWHRLSRHLPDVLFLNMEDALLRMGCSSPVEFADYLRNEYPFVKAIFIDEAQHMDDAGLFVKGIVDTKPGIPLWVTGSSAFDLHSRTRESLAGRATRLRLLPFSVRELMNAHNQPNPVATRRTFDEALAHQLIFGSYPAVYLSSSRMEKIEILNDLVEASILRDASDLFRIKRVDAFRKLLTLIAAQIGSIANFSELAALCNVNVGTVNAYLEILEESHIVKRVSPFAGGKRREITGAQKVFFIDNGIRNQLLNSFSEETTLRVDTGQIFENWVFGEIWKNMPLAGSIKYWRSKANAEVDFVIDYAGEYFALEAKWGGLKGPKLTKSAQSFLEAYKPKQFAILNATLTHDMDVKGGSVRFITPHGLTDWLAGIFSEKS